MMEDKHKLDKLAIKLNSRTNEVEAQYNKHELQKKAYETPKVWDDDLSLNIENSLDNQLNMSKKIKNPFHKLLFSSFIFLVISLAVGTYFIIGGGNSVSSDNINIAIGGPIQIGGGQELSLDVGVENKNNVPLQVVDVVIDYPSGTKTADDKRADLKRVRVNIGDVESGQFAHKLFKSVLFGEEGTTKDIKVSIEYRVPGSNAIFEKEKMFSIVLNASPLSITMKGLKEITSGQEATFEITITSNSESVLNDIVLKAEYPFGYSFKEASPNTSDGNDTWKIAKLSPKESRIIKVVGTLQGQNSEDRYFKFVLGNALSSDDTEVGTVLALASQVVAIKKSFLGISLLLNNSDASEYSLADGGAINAAVDWINNSITPISNAEFVANISGDILDASTVLASNGGYFDATNKTITWDRRTTDSLAQIKPGAKGRLSFSFKVKSKDIKNQEFKIDIGVKAQRVSDNDVEENINSAASKIVKLSTGLHLASKALYFSGPFENSGPVPPKSDTETTFAIVWTITNDFNNVADAKVTAKLPSYVSWTNVVTPTSEKISYDSVTGEIVWDVGNVIAEAGFSKPKREVAFQVKLKPSVTQIGSSPNLVSNQALKGRDTFADVDVIDSRKDLNTRLVADPGFSNGDETVQ